MRLTLASIEFRHLTISTKFSFFSLFVFVGGEGGGKARGTPKKLTLFPGSNWSAFLIYTRAFSVSPFPANTWKRWTRFWRKKGDNNPIKSFYDLRMRERRRTSQETNASVFPYFNKRLKTLRSRCEMSYCFAVVWTTWALTYRQIFNFFSQSLTRSHQ